MHPLRNIYIYIYTGIYINNSSAVREINSPCQLLRSSSASVYLDIQLETHLHFVILYKIFEVLIKNCIKSSNPIFNVHYISQYIQLDIRRDIVHNIHGIVIYIYIYIYIYVYISYCDFMLSMKMAFIAETCC